MTSIEELRELFQLGFYSKVIDQYSSVSGSDEEAEFLLLRSRVVRDPLDFVISATKAGTTPAQRGIRFLAEALRLPAKEDVERALEGADAELAQASPYYAICVALVDLRVARYVEALEVLDGCAHPEAAGLRIQALLGLHRPDLAERELTNIGKGTIQYVMCKALVALFLGREEAKNALFELLDLSERFESSVVLANLIAVCHFAIGEWENGRGQVLIAEGLSDENNATKINAALSLFHSSDDFQKLSDQTELVRSLKNEYSFRIQEMLRDFDETAETIKNQ